MIGNADGVSPRLRQQLEIVATSTNTPDRKAMALGLFGNGR